MISGKVFRAVLGFLVVLASGLNLVGCSSANPSSQSSTPTQVAPSITSLSATSAMIGSPAFSLTITGQNFLPSSVVQFGGVSLISFVNSSTQIVATVPAASLASVGANTVTVIDPSPLSLVSNALTFTVNPIPPTVSFTNPTSAIVNTGPISLTIYGQNFSTGAKVTFSGTILTISGQSVSTITASIPASLLTATGPQLIVVSNPAPNAASSIGFVFTVNPVPVPTITAISPSSVTAGASAFSLQVSGQAFGSGSTVQLNGNAVKTNVNFSGQLTATVPDNAVAAAGTVAVTVLSPGTGAGPITSNSQTLTVNPLPAGDIIVNQIVNDIVWDSQHKVIYGSVPSSAAKNGNNIVTIDPTSGAITSSVFAGSEPDLLAVSDDGQFLYVALDGSSAVKRFILPGMTPDISVSLGGSTFFGLNTAIALAVAPGAPHTYMVSVGDPGTSPEAIPGITVFDDAVARPTSAGRYTQHPSVSDLLLGTAVWGKDASILYGGNNESTGFDFYVLSVDATGIPGASIKDYSGALSGFGATIHFDKTTGYVYGDNGVVLNPASGGSVGVFSTNGIMVPDGTIGKAFFIASQYGSTNAVGTITSFDMTHFTPISSVVFPNVVGGTSRIIRWGTNGLAFNSLTTNYTGTTSTKTGKLFILSGSFVQ